MSNLWTTGQSLTVSAQWKLIWVGFYDPANNLRSRSIWMVIGCARHLDECLGSTGLIPIDPLVDRLAAHFVIFSELPDRVLVLEPVSRSFSSMALVSFQGISRPPAYYLICYRCAKSILLPVYPVCILGFLLPFVGEDKDEGVAFVVFAGACTRA